MRTRTSLFAAATILLCGWLLGCDAWPLGRVVGSGTAATATRDVGDFTQIEFLGTGRVEVTIGDPQPLELTGDDNILPLIQTRVTDGKLSVRPTRSFLPKQPLVVRATVTNLAAIVLTGAGEIVVTGLDNDGLQATVTGAGTLTLSGQTASLTVTITGAGSADAADLAASAATVSVSGAGSATVHAVDTLDVTIEGVGSVTYSGDPVVTQHISGLGTLQKAGG